MMLLATAVAGAVGAVARWGLDQAVRAGLARCRPRDEGAGCGNSTDAAARPSADAAAWPGGLAAPALQVQPTGIVVVNVVGCLLAGLVAGTSLPSSLRTLLLVGFLGGFTTFSTAVLDLAQLGARQPGRAVAVGGATLVAGLAAARLGLALAGTAEG